MTNVSIALRSMAQRLGVTIFALSQVTPPDRDIKGKRRHLIKEDLRESRQILQDANEILMLDYEDTGKNYGPRVLIIDKNKDGELGRIRLGFDPQHMRFYPIKQNDQPVDTPKAKPESIPGQAQFVELSEAQTGRLPF